MAEENPREDNKSLIVVFLLLLFVAIILVAIIIALFLINRNPAYNLSDDNLAKECLLASEDVDLSECLEDKAFSYYEDGDCEKALKVYDDIPVEEFDEYVLSDLYNDAYSMSFDCSDESLQNYWKDKFEGLSSKLEVRD